MCCDQVSTLDLYSARSEDGMLHLLNVVRESLLPKWFLGFDHESSCSQAAGLMGAKRLPGRVQLAGDALERTQ